MLHNIENRLLFEEYKIVCFELLRLAYRVHESTGDPQLKAAIEAIYRDYEELKPRLEQERAPEPPSPDRLLSKEDQGVGRQERLL